MEAMERAKALRAEALALRDAGDKRGALMKVREAKDLEAAAASKQEQPAAQASYIDEAALAEAQAHNCRRL